MAENDRWIVSYDELDIDEHPLQEALCTLGNGYFTSRAALEMERNKSDQGEKNTLDFLQEGKEWNYPGTYLACGFNRLGSKVKDKIIENEDLINWPNWLYLNFKVDSGSWMDISKFTVLVFETHLNLQQGVLKRIFKVRDKEGRITAITSKRIISMHNHHLAAIQWKLIPENWSGKLTIRSAIDGDIVNNNVDRYKDLNQKHIEVMETGFDESGSMYLVSQSKQSKIRVAMAGKTKVFTASQTSETHRKAHSGKESFVAEDIEASCRKGETLTIEKTVAFYTSRDMAITEPLTEATSLLNTTPRFSALNELHSHAWKEIWQYNDIQIKTNDPIDQLVLRLHTFHLYQTVSYHSIDYDIGIPARGWHGEAYRGHIFWDELYIQPFIDLHYPQLSRSLMMYRYRRLKEARKAAAEKGFRGAMFPWQSGSNGREETQKVHLNPESGRWLPDVSHLQYHINAAIPYNVWHYYQSTSDMDFLLSHGAEIILSCALFWSDIATWNKERERFEIKKVMGPDEYHTHYPEADENDPGLNNNAYTNIMAVWVIQKAIGIFQLLDEDCCSNLKNHIGITEDDIARWKNITHKMFVPIRENIIMQFEGYHKLKELNWDYYHKKHGHSLRLDRILEAEGDTCNNYKASKQADVLMLFYLFSSEELQNIFKKLNYEFNPDIIPLNIEYYRKRTAHGSTLSQIIHAWVYARSHRKESWKRFKKALMSDFQDVQGGTTREGIHLGAMAGTLDIIQRCYTGMEIRDDILWFNPTLPDDIEHMAFHIRYRSHWIQLEINQKRMKIFFDKGWANPVTIGVKGKTHRFETNDKKEFKL